MIASVIDLAVKDATGADLAAQSFPGGRAVIVADATTFPTTCQVQGMCPNGSWVSVGSNLTAASISSGLDLPAGYYRLHQTGGTALNVSVKLCRVPY